MAGRPQRRLRSLLRNPLLEYSQMSKPSIAGMAAHYRTLYRPAAEESYKEAFARVPLNIHVVFGDYEHLRSHYELRDVHRGRSAVFLMVATDIRLRPGAQAEKPGHPDRITSFTPFTLLHRLGDHVRKGAWAETVVQRHEDEYELGDTDPEYSGIQLSELSQYLDDAYLTQLMKKPHLRSADMVSAGVGTAAGRLNALDGVSEMWSDLFAKYLLTQRFDFDPEAGTFPKEIRELRREWAVIAYEHMKNVLARLQERGAFLYLSL